MQQEIEQALRLLFSGERITLKVSHSIRTELNISTPLTRYFTKITSFPKALIPVYYYFR